MFKTTGQQMSDAFTAVGANATSAGIGLSEQMAILGQLQATMSGGEAGTKYKAFLSGVGGSKELSHRHRSLAKMMTCHSNYDFQSQQ